VVLVAVHPAVEVTAILRAVVSALPVARAPSARSASRSDTQQTTVGIDLKKITFWSHGLLQPLLDQSWMMLGTRIQGPRTTLLESLISSMHEPYTGTDQIHIANGSGMEITRIGTSLIPTSSCDLVLNKVLHVPSTHKNIISIHRFTLDNDTYIEFHLFLFLIKDQKTRKMLLHGPCRGGLYPLLSTSSKFHKLVFHAIKIPVDHWHSRLSHPSRDIVRGVISKNNLPCTTIDSLNSSVCDTCACAKAHQLPYQLSSNTSSAPLQLIFSDVWGHAIESFGRKRYYVSFIDDYSKFTWIYLLRHKSEVYKYFLSFRPLLSTCLIARVSPSNPTGVGNMSISIPYSTKLASLIKCLVLIPINKTGLRSASIVI
jgi:hypothetical protein